MLFYVKYQVDRDKQSDTQAFFANMSEEERAKEIPDGVNLVGRWHDLPNGWGVAIVEAESPRGYDWLGDVLVRCLHIPGNNTCG